LLDGRFEQLPRIAVLYLKRSRIVLSEIRTMLHPSRTSGSNDERRG
jgi:hypothetical protein